MGGGRKILGFSEGTEEDQSSPTEFNSEGGRGGGEEGGGRKWYHKKITQTEPESFSPPPQAINNDPSPATPSTARIEVKTREYKLFIFYGKTNKT